MAVAAQGIQEFAEIAVGRALLGDVVGRPGNGHQSAQTQTGQPRHMCGQPRKFVRRHPRLAWFLTELDLETDLQRRQVRRAKPVQAVRQACTIQTVQPVEALGDVPAFVGLQRADEMPDQRWISQRVHFFQRLFEIALAELTLASTTQVLDCGDGLSLGYRQQPDQGWIPLDLARCIANPRMYRSISIACLSGCDRLKADQGLVANSRVSHGLSEWAMDIAQLLSFSVKNGASDLHLSAGLPPMIRVDGDVRRINLPPMEPKQTHDLIYDIMNDRQRKEYEEYFETDFSFAIAGLARFRVNAFNQNRGPAAVFRTVPEKILTLEQLACPAIFKELALKPRGIVLVTGPTGSGKSTTLAAMIDYVNDNEAGHILTIEDPIEFVHPSKRCLVNQREVKRDTHGFAEALRSALREDPDVILVGEMRDLETIRLALTAAETGHMVFGTLHTSSAAKTIDRIVDVFPAAEKDMVRAMLSESLQAVISQSLLKKKAGGRIAAHEIMIGTPAIRNLIRENKIAQMYSSIQTGQQFGMQTLDQCLQDLVRKNMITKEIAKAKAVHKDNF